MSALDYLDNAIPFIMEGQVIGTDDPDQMGRCKVWVPSLDGENFDIDALPWSEYASPFMGFTVDFPAGKGDQTNQSHVAYGMWAIPKIGSTVLVFCLNANPAVRFYFAATTRLHRNRSLPAGRNVDDKGNPGPYGDAEDDSGNLLPIQPAYNNLRAQFAGNVTASEAKTRGGFERTVAQGKTDKDGTDGYTKSAVDTYLDPQTYCIVTPGRHAIIMQDDPKGSRMRFKTGEGHQIIFDDANERIYVSTAKGNSWIELDEDGHIHVFGSDSISIRSGKDINMFADGSINLEAGKNVNIKADTGYLKVDTATSFYVKAGGDIRQSACGIFDLDSEDSIKITAANSLDILTGDSIAINSGSNMDLLAGSDLAVTGGDAVDILASGALTLTGAPINLNGPPATSASPATAASCPDDADSPTVVPGHEPWTRPATSGTRNANWKA